MKSRILITLIIICIEMNVQSQSSSKNYIVITNPIYEISSPELLNDQNANSAIEYFDGLGRSVETVQKQFTPQEKDFVNYIEYDGIGRESIHWLPAPSTNTTGEYVNLSEFINNAHTQYGSSESPFTTTQYESSPLNRVTGQFGAGAAWYNQNKKIATTYDTNIVNEVVYFYVNANNQLQRGGYYAQAILYKTTVTDEDGKISSEYKDKLGQVVMKRSTSGNVDTYYVYNDLGQLSYVLPPLAVDNLTTNQIIQDSNPILQQYAYLYKYDDRGNCTQKRLPGCDWIYMVYDRADRLILSQDGNQRKTNQWTVSKYDMLGRVLYTGITTSTTTLSTLITNLKDSLITETWTSSGSLLGTGYTCRQFTPTKLLTVNYYDNYDFVSLTSSSLSYISSLEQTYGIKHSSAQGLLTGTRTYLLDNSGQYTASAMYYDYRGQIIQSRNTNFLGGHDDTYNQYNFSGKVTQTHLVHNISGQSGNTTETYTNTYDRAGRLLITKYKLNNNTEILLTEGAYDELGRLKSKKRHNGTDTEEYDYNIRNWATRLKSGDFEEKLYYTGTIPNSSPAKYNGNIVASSWTYKDLIYYYTYSYDDLNRLTYAGSNSCDGNFEGFEYDKQGNITKLQRFKSWNPIDMLSTMTYNGNQLTKITDTYGSRNLSTVKEYQDLSDAETEFSYDANGNMVKDLDRQIDTIQYNLLNLPQVILFHNGNQIRNLYDAGGQKLRSDYYTRLSSATAPITANEPVYSTTDYSYTGTAYIGNKEYQIIKYASSGTYAEMRPINRIHNSEGYIDNIYTPRYYYFRRDHLGNDREVWLANTDSTVQRTQYYPSGLPWKTNTDDNPGVQPYKYNGKEFIEMHGLDETDLGARGLHHAKMRFNTMDRFAEKYPWQSPYCFAGNNPVNYIDVNGDSINVNAIQKYDNAANTNYTNTILDDWNTETGLTISISPNGDVSYSKDENGNPIVATQKDQNGNTTQKGSKTARDLLTKAIKSKDKITVSPGRRTSAIPGTNIIGVNFKQMDAIIAGTVNLDNKTLGYGMALMHEILHTNVGGGISDLPNSIGNPGPVVTTMNIIRSELNSQGGNYGQRLNYLAIRQGMTGVIPFNDSAQSTLNTGWAVAINPYAKYIKF